MRPRDLAYLLASIALSPLLHRKLTQKVLSVFTFESALALHQPQDFRHWSRTTGLFLLVGTIFACLGVNLVLCAIRGTLLIDPTDGVYSLLEDRPNVVNYLILCPLYVSLGLYFLTRAGGIRPSLRKSPLSSRGGDWLPECRRSRRRKVLVSMFIAAVGVAFASRYGWELTRYGQQFWFEPGPGGGDSVQIWYYMALNTFLMVLVCWLIAEHFELFAVSCHVGQYLESKVARTCELADAWFDPQTIRTALLPYTTLYVVSKVLVLVFVANMYTWQAQRPGFVGLFDLSVILLAALGAVVVSFPRYHIQYWLYRIWNSSDGDSRAAAVEGQYPDIRTPIVTGIAGVADIAILGGATAKLVAFVLGRVDVLSLLR